MATAGAVRRRAAARPLTALWHHTHEFATEGDGTRIRDTVQYALPLGVLGVAAHAIAVRRDLVRIFDYREQHVAEIFGSPNAKK